MSTSGGACSTSWRVRSSGSSGSVTARTNSPAAFCQRAFFAPYHALQVGLGRPLAPGLQLVDQRHRAGVAGRRLVARLVEQQDVEVLDRLQPLLVLLPAADPRVEGPAGVAGEPRRAPRPRLELRRDARVARAAGAAGPAGRSPARSSGTGSARGRRGPGRTPARLAASLASLASIGSRKDSVLPEPVPVVMARLIPSRVVHSSASAWWVYGGSYRTALQLPGRSGRGSGRAPGPASSRSRSAKRRPVWYRGVLSMNGARNRTPSCSRSARRCSISVGWPTW